MADLLHEDLISLNEATRLKWLPRRRKGKRTHISTMIRWAKQGIGGVKLETLRVGNALCTSEPALRRFFERLSEPDRHSSFPTPSQRRRAHDRAEAELEAAGI